MQNATHGTLRFQHDFWTGKRAKLGTATVGAVRSLAPVFDSLADFSDKMIFGHGYNSRRHAPFILAYVRDELARHICHPKFG